ncbi:hypothetical protein B0T19DRAFT_222512 [Cercophora scortea]|uniref:Uncharacterized protein n=1 Tax=Cercophora scortea TaxID=314031 RepID=A0AAE0IFR5_9PEZI|nr:hypothetical protein B0T19DRAFT_222512 [Cercophora scortea]
MMAGCSAALPLQLLRRGPFSHATHSGAQLKVRQRYMKHTPCPASSTGRHRYPSSAFAGLAGLPLPYILPYLRRLVHGRSPRVRAVISFKAGDPLSPPGSFQMLGIQGFQGLASDRKKNCRLSPEGGKKVKVSVDLINSFVTCAWWPARVF